MRGREDALVSRGWRGGREGRGSGRGGGQYVDGGDPVIVREGGLPRRRQAGADVLDREERLGREPMGGEVRSEGCAQQGAVDEEVEWHGRVGGRGEQGVDERGQCVAAEVCEVGRTWWSALKLRQKRD